MLLKEIIRPYYLRWLYFPFFPHRRPDYFRACWEFPERDLIGQTMLGETDSILFLPMTDWHTRIQRTQHLARGFAALGRQCFYVNPHLGREFPKPYPFSSSPRVHVLEPRITEVHIHLPLEPVFHHRMLRAGENERVRTSLWKLFRLYRTERLVQFVSYPIWLNVSARLKKECGFPIVYDCHDALAGFQGVPHAMVEAEEEMLRLSDLAVFSSQKLLDDHVRRQPAIEPKAILVRNAVEEAWLKRRIAAPDPKPPVVGYVGALDFWFDAEAVRQAAEKHPEWEFHMIGRVEDKRITGRLGKLPNVRFPGEVPHKDLHRYLARFRVAIIPFLRSELTLGTNPIKLYEYFSYGLPVVSTRLPEMEEFGDLVYLFDPGRFTSALELAMREVSPVLCTRRKEIAQREVWTARVQQLNEAVTAVY